MPSHGPSSGSPSTPSLTSLARIVEAAEHIAGPWTSGAPGLVAASLRHAGARERSLSEVVRRFEPELERPVVLDAQEWWSSAPQPG